MKEINALCVFCASRQGNNPKFETETKMLGLELAKENIRLIYGGGARGLMGTIAKSVLDHGGKVTGIIPEFLIQYELKYEGLDEMIVTQDMHERKRLLAEKSDGFVILPGGMGTLEEVTEQITWLELHLHDKPIVFANIDGYWQPFFDLINHMEENGVARKGLLSSLLICDKIEDIIPKLKGITHAPNLD